MNIFKKKYCYETNEISAGVDDDYKGFTLTAKILNEYEKGA